MTHVILEVPDRDQRKEGVWLILGIRVNVMGRKKMLITQSCPTLCNPTDCNPPGSSVHGILPEYWGGLPFPPPGDLPHPGIKPESPVASELQEPH